MPRVDVVTYGYERIPRKGEEMRKRLAAVGLAAALALAGGGAVACGNDADDEAEEIREDTEQILEEGEEKLDELKESIEENN